MRYETAPMWSPRFRGCLLLGPVSSVRCQEARKRRQGGPYSEAKRLDTVKVGDTFITVAST
jgi:hypothetical protein